MRFFEAFRRRFLLMHVGGIPVWADYRWVFVLLLMSAITAGNLETKFESVTASYIVGFLTTIVFFASVLVHEVAHAVIARGEGVEVLEIVRHPCGGRDATSTRQRSLRGAAGRSSAR